MKALHIRNFSIIAHIDHGKSTLADRLLEFTGVLQTQHQEQVLDSMELEREHGVTIKAHPVTIPYKALDGTLYTLNLIDTPGHVDFSYEVSRSIAATEGAVLLVDSTQGVEAQTLAHFYLANSQKKRIIPVLNKIDLPYAEIQATKQQLINLGFREEDFILVSAKEGIGVREVLEAVVKRIPPPSGSSGPLRALIFDSWFDPYRGVILCVRVVDGELRGGMEIKLMSNEACYEVDEVGVFNLSRTKRESLSQGEVGYIVAGIKEIGDARIGDTITSAKEPSSSPLPEYKETKPMVFCGLYPVDGTPYSSLLEGVKKLRLNDSSWSAEAETSATFGPGFRCGFLGLFHAEIIQERLEREYNLKLLATSPNVPYRIMKKNGEIVEVSDLRKFPNQGEIRKIEEPYVKATILVPHKYVGGVVKFLEQRRGVQKSFQYLDVNRALLLYELPLVEVIVDFHDRLKSITQGYASFDYEHIGFREGELVKLDILVGGERIDELSVIVPKEEAWTRGTELVEKMKELIPRHQFTVSIQAAIGKRVIARGDIAALRKNVTSKCYGGDFTRKRKLLEKQKRGKKRLKKFGKVNIPQEAFRAILSSR